MSDSVTLCRYCDGTTARHTVGCLELQEEIGYGFRPGGPLASALRTAPATTATDGTTGSVDPNLGRPQTVPPMGSFAKTPDRLHALKGTMFEHTIRPDLPPNPKQAYGDKKVPLQFVPPAAELYIALALQDGAKKYDPFNWRTKAVEAMTYIGALRRHIDAWVDGEDNARDSGYPHLAHAIACLAILIDSDTIGNLIDNRPPRGAAADILAAWEKP